MDATDTAVDAKALTPTGFTGPEREATWKGVRGLVGHSIFSVPMPDFWVDLRQPGALTLTGVRGGRATPPPTWPAQLHSSFEGATLADILDTTQTLLSAAGVPEICKFEATHNLYTEDALEFKPIASVLCGPVRDAATIPVGDSYDFLDGVRVSWRGRLSERVGSVSTGHSADIGDGFEALVIRSCAEGVWEATTTWRFGVDMHQSGSGFSTLADVLAWTYDVYTNAYGGYDGRAAMFFGLAVAQDGTDEPALTIVAW